MCPLQPQAPKATAIHPSPLPKEPWATFVEEKGRGEGGKKGEEGGRKEGRKRERRGKEMEKEREKGERTEQNGMEDKSP